MTSGKNYYLTNEELLFQLSASYLASGCTNELGESFCKLVTHIMSKYTWGGYPKQVKDELTSDAYCALCNAWNKFDILNPEMQNPFSYFTTVVLNSFRRTINKEKAHMGMVSFLTHMQARDSERWNHYTQMHNVDEFVNDDVPDFIATHDTIEKDEE